MVLLTAGLNGRMVLLFPGLKMASNLGWNHKSAEDGT